MLLIRFVVVLWIAIGLFCCDSWLVCGLSNLLCIWVLLIVGFRYYFVGVCLDLTWFVWWLFGVCWVDWLWVCLCLFRFVWLLLFIVLALGTVGCVASV